MVYMKGIRKLDEEVSSQIDALSTVTSIKSALRELLKNSIDANASKVTVVLDLATFSFQVCDNGGGIPETDLSLVGLQNYSSMNGVPYSSVRHKGNSLYSISQLGIVSIISSSGPSMLRLYGEQRESFKGERDCKLSNPNFSFSFDGKMTTSVAVSNLFANVPVRRRVLEGMPKHKVLEDVRSLIFELLLGNTFEVEVGLVEEISGGEEGKIRYLFKVPASTFALEPLELYSKVYTLIYREQVIFNEVVKQIGKYKVVGIYSNERKYKSHIWIVVNGNAMVLKDDDMKSISTLHSIVIFKITVSEVQLGSIMPQTRYYDEIFKLCLKVLRGNDQLIPLRSSSKKELSPSKNPGGSLLKRSNLLDEGGETPPKKHKLSDFRVAGLGNLQKYVNASETVEGVSYRHFCSENLDGAEVLVANIQFKKTDLMQNNFKVIRQLDKKFILLTVKEPFALLAIDQHACDERIRYEVLLKNLIDEIENPAINLCVPLEKEIELSCSGIEDQEVFAANVAYFQIWGVQYRVGDTKLVITHLPRLIIDKLETYSKEHLSEYLFQYVYELENKVKSALQGRRNPGSWYEIVRNLPRVLTDILSTKACKSSIVFGTELTQAEMHHFVLALGVCENPFQCAHGRPSIVGVAQ